jgi:hypothetical protein
MLAVMSKTLLVSSGRTCAIGESARATQIASAPDVRVGLGGSAMGAA